MLLGPLTTVASILYGLAAIGERIEIFGLEWNEKRFHGIIMQEFLEGVKLYRHAPNALSQ